MESGNEYVLQVKGNQRKLQKAIKETIVTTTPADVDYTLEKNRGRIEEREVYVYDELSHPIYGEWPGIRHVIHVVSQGIRANKKYLENRYYISSKTSNQAAMYNRGIRAHWGIENSLHWVKDVVLNEDKGMIRDLDRSGNMSMIRNMVMNVFRIHGFGSIKKAIEIHTNRLDSCLNLIYDIDIY